MDPHGFIRRTQDAIKQGVGEIAINLGTTFSIKDPSAGFIAMLNVWHARCLELTRSQSGRGRNMLLQKSKILAACVVLGMMAAPAAATWGWGGGKPKPPKPTTPPPTGSSGGGTSSGGATPVPEPEMMVLFGLGAGALLVQRRRKRA